MLEQRLRDHIESIAEPVDLAEVFEREGAAEVPLTLDLTQVNAAEVVGLKEASEAPRWPVARALAVAAVSVLVVLGVLVSIDRLGEQPVATEGGLADELEVDGEELSVEELFADATWVEQRADFVSLVYGNETFVNDITFSNGVFWAVGRESSSAESEEITTESGGVSGVSRSRIWRSSDTNGWLPVDRFESLPEPIDGVVDFQEFTAVVGTDDGATWVFGEGFRSNATGVTFSHLGYRATNGFNWEELTLPADPEDATLLSSASADGDTVLVVFERSESVTMDSLGNVLQRNEATRQAFTTTDGIIWETVGNPAPAETTQYAMFGGEVVTFNAPPAAGFETVEVQLDAGPDVLLATQWSVPDGRADTPANREATFWRWTEVGEWAVIDVPIAGGRNPITVTAGAQFEGIIILVLWEDGESTSFDVFEIDSSGTVTERTEFPALFVQDVFADQSVLATAGDADATEQSIWVLTPSLVGPR